MKKISRNVLKIILILIILQFIFAPISRASFIGDIISAGDEFLEEGEKGQTVIEDGTVKRVINEKELKEQINVIYNVLFAIGVALSVIIGAILGIKFMMGNVEEKVKVKETLVPYITGCIVVFGAFGIWKLVITIAGNVMK